MNILYIAYSCSPNHGSEDRIGWKIPYESSKNNNVIVITKKEHESVINGYIKQNPLNIKFHFVDIPEIFKKIYKGVFYSGRLNIWQKRAVALAEEICKSEKVDIIHQITPVEFRSMGDYGRISDVKFVCGPVGGGEFVPQGLRRYINRNMHFEVFRFIANRLNYLKIKRKGMLNRCDALLFANRETEKYMLPILKRNTGITACVSEIGIDGEEISDLQKDVDEFREKRIFLVSGRLVYRKGHALLTDALSRLPEELDYKCYIAGNGKELNRLKKRCKKAGLEKRVVFLGRIAFDEMENIYRKAHALIMPSIRETTGSVILEAMSKGLPVITINKFGGAVLLNENNSWLYDGKTHEEYIENLKNVIEECISDEDKLAEKSLNALSAARQNTWEHKVAYYNSVYQELLTHEK